MLVLGRTVKILLGSGALLLMLWITLLIFSASSIDETADYEPYYEEVKQPRIVKRKNPPKEPDTPWRRVSLKELTIPESAKIEAKNIKPKMLRVNVRLIDTYTLLVNPPVLKSNLTFLFLHGAAFTSKDWFELGTLGLLGALGYKVHAVDMPGFGKTPTKLDGIPENYVSKVDYMVHLVKELEIPKGKLVLVFPSMSGNYGLPYVLTEPEMCAGVIPISPAASGIVPPSKVRALQVPTMLLYGDRDTSFGPVSHQDLKYIPNFHAMIIEKAGHAAYLDQPDTFHSLLYNFVQKIESHPW